MNYLVFFFASGFLFFGYHAATVKDVEGYAYFNAGKSASLFAKAYRTVMIISEAILIIQLHFLKVFWLYPML